MCAAEQSMKHPSTPGIESPRRKKQRGDSTVGHDSLMCTGRGQGRGWMILGNSWSRHAIRALLLRV